MTDELQQNESPDAGKGLSSHLFIGVNVNGGLGPLKCEKVVVV